jgi:hypothetical protein
MNPSQQPSGETTPRWRRPMTLAWAAAVVIAVFYLLREHWGHLLGVWPYLLLMLCPLMHLLHGHGQHRDHDHGQDRR